MARRLKVMMADQLRQRLDNAGDLLLVDFSGLNSDEDFAARKELRTEGLTVGVVKNSILRRVLTESGNEFPEETYAGPLALVLGEADAITASKSIAGWRRKNGKVMALKGGMLEGEALGPAEAERLVKMPSVQETRTAVVSAIAGPLTSLVAISQNLLTGVPGVLQAIADKQSKEGE
jgi:large subunit ribosomal protein L10